MNNIKVKDGSPIVFVVKNKNDFEVKNVEIFNPKGQKKRKGVEIISTYDESMQLYTLQQIYDYLNEGNIMAIKYISADCLSVKVPKKICKLDKKAKDWKIDSFGDLYFEYEKNTIRSAVASKVKINIRGIDYWNRELFITRANPAKRLLLDMGGGGCVIFRFDSTTKITLDSIPQLTEVRYIFNQ